MSLDMPLWTVVETAATLYEKDAERFHLLLTEPLVLDWQGREPQAQPDSPLPRLLWLEISPYRVTMTMQGNGQFSYRHYWEQGVYGVSRYWLRGNDLTMGNQMRLRNYTRELRLTRNPLPQHLRVEYELWAEQVRMGTYVLNVEIHH